MINIWIYIIVVGNAFQLLYVLTRTNLLFCIDTHESMTIALTDSCSKESTNKRKYTQKHRFVNPISNEVKILVYFLHIYLTFYKIILHFNFSIDHFKQSNFWSKSKQEQCNFIQPWNVWTAFKNHKVWRLLFIKFNF